MYRSCGVQGVIIENMHDTPYVTENNIGRSISISSTFHDTFIIDQLPDRQQTDMGIYREVKYTSKKDLFQDLR